MVSFGHSSHLILIKVYILLKKCNTHAKVQASRRLSPKNIQVWINGEKEDREKKEKEKMLINLIPKKHYPWNAVKQMFIIMQLIFIQKDVCVNKVEVCVHFNKATISLENQIFFDYNFQCASVEGRPEILFPNSGIMVLWQMSCSSFGLLFRAALSSCIYGEEMTFVT